MLLVTVVALVLPVGLGVRVDGQIPSVVINELLWMGSPASAADEWIEFRNLSETTVDLSGWKLTRKSSGQEVAILTIPSGRSIEPRGFFLISNFAASSTSTHLAVEPDVVDTAVSLLNSGLEVKLYDASGVLVDIADDGSGTPLAGKYVSGETYGSMARNGLPGDGTKKESWHTSTIAVNLKSGSIVLGTPRSQNDNVPPVVPIVSDQQAAVGVTVTFDGSDAHDPDGDTLQFWWAFGDGATSQAVAPTHVYLSAGSYVGTLAVDDGTGSTSVNFTVTVSPPPVPDSPPPLNNPTPSTSSLTINELFPNPDGADDGEFIEFVASGGDVDLSGWSVSDESGTTYKFPGGTKITNGSFVVLKREQSKIALNNDGDTVRLKNAAGTVVHEVHYSDVEENSTYAWDGSTWQWTTKPTPGSANEIVKPNHPPEAKFSVSKIRRVGEPVTFDASDSTDVDGDVRSFAWDFGDGEHGTGRTAKHRFSEEGPVVVQLTVRDATGLEDSATREFTVRPPLKNPSRSKKSATKKGTVKGAATVRTIAEAQTADSSTVATVEGWVTVPPSMLGDGVFYVSDGRGGIAIRSNEPLPKLSIGDVVKITGKRRTKYSEPYVLVERAVDVVLRGERQEPAIVDVQAADLDERVGSLVRVTGEVTTLSGSRFTVDDGSGELAVYVRASTGFKRPAMRSGDRVGVSGILSRTSSGLRLLPRMKDDIRVVEPILHTTSASPVNVAKKASPTWWMYLLVAAAVVGGAGVGWWKRGVK
ncbi:MAG: lamin tail domain-containing protein [Candidatus Kerfeldbacteria bacterium]|nr:lamin tail domain-containing protein [Candidatus Kerfeldbacteria bacterium]